MASYTALTGLNYPDGSGAEKRIEAGQTVDDIPAKSVKWLLDQHLIEATPAPDAPVAAAEAI